jgi:hypothetical protein
LGLPGTLCLLSRILVSVLLLAEVQHLSPIFSITNLMGHIVVDCFSDLQVGLNVPDTNKRICFLNISADEVIRSLFYNKNNDSLITVSVYASDNFSSLKCRTTPIEYVSYYIQFLIAFIS